MLIELLTVLWTIRPDGPTTFTISKQYPGSAHWACRPDENCVPPEEVVACKEVPNERLAKDIARFLNSR